MLDELHILYPYRLYPIDEGSSMRTMNIAKLASSNFITTTIFAADEKCNYIGRIDNININQLKKYHNFYDKIKYYYNGLLSADFSPALPRSVFNNKSESVFQLEGPFSYNMIQKEDIKKFILNEHNIYWEFPSFQGYNLKYKIYHKFARKRDKLIEIKACTKSSHILVCSERDKQVLVKEIPKIKEKITIIPNCVNLSEYKDRPGHNDLRNNEKLHVLFVGTLSFGPNLDAVSLICKSIAPNCDNAEFIIIGKNPPNIMKPKNVKFLGYVNDVKGYIAKSDICIAPLRNGSGTRLKILEYMAMGKAVISTSKGAEGLDYSDDNIIIEDDISKFPHRIQELAEDKMKRKRIGINGMKLIEHKYDWKLYGERLSHIYEEIGR